MQLLVFEELNFRKMPTIHNTEMYFNNKAAFLATLWDQLRTLNIPVYYTCISGTALYDFQGAPVKFPEGPWGEDYRLSEDETLTTQFFQTPLHQFMLERFTSIIQNEGLRQQLIERLHTEYDEAYQQRTGRNPDLLLEINLNPDDVNAEVALPQPVQMPPAPEIVEPEQPVRRCTLL